MNFKHIQNSTWGRLSLKIIVLICILFVVDLAISSLIKHLAKQNKSEELRYVAATAEKSEIIILGASKATTNYNTKLLEDLTGHSVYNLGTTGTTVIVQYAQLLRILSTYKPSLIIIELIGNDLNQELLDSRSGRTLDRLLIHSDLKEVNSLLCDLDSWHRFKAVFKSYRYISVLGDIIFNTIRPSASDSNLKGYKPIKVDPGFVRRMSGPTNKAEDQGYSYVRSEILTDVFKAMLSLLKAQQANVLFVKSPNYQNAKRGIDPLIVDLLAKNGFELTDSNVLAAKFDASVIGYYSDDLHLSEAGAKAYSKLISELILKHFD